jgi:hypothetical protein
METEAGQQALQIVKQQQAIAYEEKQEMATMEQFTALREQIAATTEPVAMATILPVPNREYFEARRPKHDEAHQHPASE